MSCHVAKFLRWCTSYPAISNLCSLGNLYSSHERCCRADIGGNTVSHYLWWFSAAKRVTMWLINANTRKLEQFFGEDVPKYAILSHTWAKKGEVSFQDISQSYASSMSGYDKIKKTCRRALRHGLKYAWVDTCCIDKTSSADLTESINSMFKYYRDAQNCYVYLSDLPTGLEFPRSHLARCRWFTRGWTLQELVACGDLRIYDKGWNFVGSRREFSAVISSITNIDENVLRGEKTVQSFSIATRMSWAARRQTARTEDLAYCLLGIFDVNMPLIYGEGKRAFRRLQEEIVKRSNDLTIFAWDRDGQESLSWGLFALSPNDFKDSKDIRPYSRQYVDPEFAMTNKGLRMDDFNYLKYNTKTMVYFIALGKREITADKYDDFCLELRKIGPDSFARSGRLLTDKLLTSIPTLSTLSFYIHSEVPETETLRTSQTGSAIHFVKHEHCQLLRMIPERRWDHAKQLFFAPLTNTAIVLAVSCAVRLGSGTKDVVIYISFETTPPLCRIFDAESYSSYSTWLFRQQRLNHDVTWDDVEADMPGILDFTDRVELVVGYWKHTLSVHIQQGVVPSISEDMIYSLTLQISGL